MEQEMGVAQFTEILFFIYYLTFFVKLVPWLIGGLVWNILTIFEKGASEFLAVRFLCNVILKH